MTKQLEGQVALLTGAVRRNGRAMALALANDGADIVINTRSSIDEAEALAKEIIKMVRQMRVSGFIDKCRVLITGIFS